MTRILFYDIIFIQDFMLYVLYDSLSFTHFAFSSGKNWVKLYDTVYKWLAKDGLSLTFLLEFSNHDQWLLLPVYLSPPFQKIDARKTSH